MCEAGLDEAAEASPRQRPCTGATARTRWRSSPTTSPDFLGIFFLVSAFTSLRSSGSRSPSWSRAAHYAKLGLWAPFLFLTFSPQLRTSTRPRSLLSASIGFGFRATPPLSTPNAKASTRGDRSETIFKKYLCRISGRMRPKTPESQGCQDIPSVLLDASIQRSAAAAHGCPADPTAAPRGETARRQPKEAAHDPARRRAVAAQEAQSTMAGVEIPFVAKTIDPDAIKGGSKAARRKEVAKKKWHNELIRFEAQFPNGDTEKFRLPRQKCDERSLQQFIFRTKQPFLIDYLQEASSGEIIYPGEKPSRSVGYVQQSTKSYPNPCEKLTTRRTKKAMKVQSSFGTGKCPSAK